MKTWVKLYTEINRDPKIGKLTWAQRGIWTALLALAGELDDQDEGQPTGMIGTVDDIAWCIRCEHDELAAALRIFDHKRMVHRTGITPHTPDGSVEGVWYITHFQKRQERPASEQPAAVAERVKRHRANKAELLREPVTDCNAPVTACNAPRFRIDTDSDTDTDSESMPDILDGLRVESEGFLDGLQVEKSKPLAAEPIAAPTPARKGRTFPANTGIYVSKVRAAYPEDKNLWPNAAQVEAIESTVEDVPLFERTIDFWVGRGWNPRNVIGMLEMYLDGGPKSNGKGKRNDRPVEPDLRDSQRYIDSARELCEETGGTFTQL